MSWARRGWAYWTLMILSLTILWKLTRIQKHHGHHSRYLPETVEAPKRSKRVEHHSPVKVSPKQNESQILSDVCTAKKRTAHLRSACQAHRRLFTNTKVHFGKQFIVDDQQKVIYCQVPNIGSHSMKSAIIRANLNMPKPHVLQMHQGVAMGNWQHGLEDYGLTHMTRLMPLYRNYSKFLIVRHPIDRVASAYYSLTHSGYKYKKPTLQYFLEKFELPSIQNLTLQQFAEVISDPETSPAYIREDNHWKSISEICFPCHIKYNSILRLETFRIDSQYLHKLKVSPEELPHLNRNPRSAKSLKFGVKHLQQFGKLDGKTLQKLLQRYQLDMDLFGYGYDDATHITSCIIDSKSNISCC